MRTFLGTVTASLALAACAIAGPARNDELFARVRTGMTQPEIRDLLGAPNDAMRYPLSGNTGWGYLYWDAWGFWSEFSVTFGPDGRAVSTHTRRFDGGDFN